jgi:phenylalanyl-tRNA synthetase beta chain
MLELGQPLHAFDAGKVRGEIIIRQAHPGEQFHSLDGKGCVLSSEDLVIADSDGPIALAGVMGGARSGVTGATNEILLESALFEPSSVRRSARFHDLHSEASQRFERGVDPAGVLAASARATRLIEEIAAGRGDEKVIVAGAPPSVPVRVVLRLSRCRSLLGADVPAGEVGDVLTRLGLAPTSHGEDAIEWKVPSYRRDLTREVDLIEEVARIIGIERIGGRVAARPAEPGRPDEVYDFQMSIRQQLYALGLYEARTSTLVSEKRLWSDGAPLRLRNPLGEDQAFLRTSLIPGLIAALESNIRHGARSIGLYEIGRTFRARAQEEQETLAFALYGENAHKSWREENMREFDWYDAKGIVEAIVPAPVACVRHEAGPQLALSAELLVERSRIGFLGQLAPDFARTLNATKPVLVGEFSLEMLRTIPRPTAFHDIPKFPAVQRDIAVVCPIALQYEEIESELRNANEELLSGIEPFDVFVDPAGEKLPVDRKSIAISLTFSSPGRTLNSEEVNAACERLKRRLKERLAVDFRE